MNKSKRITIIIFFVIVIIVGVILGWQFSKNGIKNNENVAPIIGTEILGNVGDLVSFSVAPGEKVSGVLSYKGVIKGGYFNEANILINILDINQNILKKSNTMTKSDWMTAEPLDFEGQIDLTGLPKGPAYFEIHNDNPSDLREYDKSILIPIMIE